MKKLLLVLCIFILCVSPARYEQNGPEETVQILCEAMKKLDLNKIGDITIAGSDEEVVIPDGYMIECIAEYVQQIEYEITDCSISGNTARVGISFSYPDISPMVYQAYNKVVAEMINGDINETPLSDDEKLDHLDKYLYLAMNETEAETADIKTSLVLVKEGGRWMLKDINRDIITVITCNYQYGLDKLRKGVPYNKTPKGMTIDA